MKFQLQTLRFASLAVLMTTVLVSCSEETTETPVDAPVGDVTTTADPVTNDPGTTDASMVPADTAGMTMTNDGTTPDNTATAGTDVTEIDPTNPTETSTTTTTHTANTTPGNTEATPMETTTNNNDIVAMPKLDHSVWTTLLKKYVTNAGNVNYKGFKGDAGLQKYLDMLAANHPDGSTSRNDAMAYWINAYNAFTIKLICDNYPISSIMNLDGGKVWDRKWVKLGSKTYSLGEIENEILRKKYKDARIHFAVNCASYSCPRLLNEAYTGAKLNSQLNTMTKSFLKDTKRNELDPKKPKISKIFEWYAVDFTTNGTVIDYINKYASTPINADAKITYLDYNWNLNE